MKLPLPLTNWIYSHLERDSSDLTLVIQINTGSLKEKRKEFEFNYIRSEKLLISSGTE